MGFFRKYGKKFAMITNSASLALFLSVLFFAYENINSHEETEKVVGNLKRIETSFFEIENSLSTRYLGIFPEYIDDINNLLSEALSHNLHSRENDTVIIFEDVLHYGVLSDPKGFRLLVRNLLDLSMQGCDVTIVHYANDSRQFKQMVIDELILPNLLNEYKKDSYALFEIRRYSDPDSVELSFDRYYSGARSVIEKYFGNEYDLSDKDDQRKVLSILNNFNRLDSVMLEHSFMLSKQQNRKKYQKSLRRIKTPFDKIEASGDNRVESSLNRLCSRIDSLKSDFANKGIDDITYADYLTFYKNLSGCIADLYKGQPCIQNVPIKENIMMCCWMIEVDGMKKAIFAFPSMYSTDEIGFISRDAAIIKYINTMLNGVKNNIMNNSGTTI